jgi:hypothetical protein
MEQTYSSVTTYTPCEGSKSIRASRYCVSNFIYLNSPILEITDPSLLDRTHQPDNKEALLTAESGFYIGSKKRPSRFLGPFEGRHLLRRLSATRDLMPAGCTNDYAPTEAVTSLSEGTSEYQSMTEKNTSGGISSKTSSAE